MEIDNHLIYGKSDIQGIVSLEAEDQALRIFQRTSEGDLNDFTIPNKYWILADRQIDKYWIRLKGDLHYKWGRQFKTVADMRQARYFLKQSEEDIFCINDGKESSMVNKGITYYKGLKPSDLSVLSFDIETTSLDPNAPDAKLLLISNTFRHKGKIEKCLISYDNYPSEKEMIEDWNTFVLMCDPDCLIGHNVFNFDIPYLYKRARLHNTNLYLGRDESPIKFDKYESKKRKDQTQDIHYFKSKIYGREIVDTYFLSIDYDVVEKKYESYGLKNIIKQEGLEKPGRVFYDANEIRNKYTNPEEWKKIKTYCVDDSDDSLALFDLMCPAKFYLANSIPKSFQEMICSASGSQLNSFLLRSYIQEAHSVPKADKVEYVKGGISFGIPGIYTNVIKIDLKSAYPSQVLRFKLYNPDKDPNGNFYKMVHHFTYERFELKDKYKETKDRYYYDREQANKIVINSAYGLCNTAGLNFNWIWGAKKITSETRQMIDFSLQWASGQNPEFFRQYMKENKEEVENE